MVRRHGRRAVDPDAPVVDLDRVQADDLEIDRIGRRPWPDAATPPAVPCGTAPIGGAHRSAARHQRPVEHRPSADEPLFELLDDWRLELAGRPLPEPPALALPVPIPSPAPAVRHRRRTWRPVLAVAAAIGAVLVGSATVGASDAGPNSPLWPITQVIWPARAESIESAHEARAALDEAHEALDAGRSGAAREAILRAEAQLDNVDQASQADMRIEVSSLLAQSVESDAGSSTFEAIYSGVEAAVIAATSGDGTTPTLDEPPADQTDSTPSPATELDGPIVAAGLPAASDLARSTAAWTASVAASTTTGPSASPPASATSAPAAPATVPDPSAVVEPPSSSAPSTTESPGSSAVQQSAPSPTQTSEGPGAVTTPGTGSGTDDGGAQSSADNPEAGSVNSAGDG